MIRSPVCLLIQSIKPSRRVIRAALGVYAGMASEVSHGQATPNAGLVAQKIHTLSDAESLEYLVFSGGADQICSGTKFYDGQGVLQDGAKDCSVGDPAGGGLVDCSVDGQYNCRATPSRPSVAAANIRATDLRAGVTIAGVAGSLSDCASDGATGCVTVSAFPSASVAAFVPTAIKSGVTLLGVTGSYGPPCLADGDTHCVVTGASGLKAAQVSDISEWDIRGGKTIAGLSGKIAFYRNMANISGFDRSTGPGALSGLDVYDTIDDYNNGSWTSPIIPTDNPWGDAIGVPGANWATVFGPCDGLGDCVMKDQTTGLLWAKPFGASKTWEDAITYCAGLNYGGYASGWRIPTHKELLQAHIDGMWTNYGSLNFWINDFWSSTTSSRETRDAFSAAVYLGWSTNGGKIAYTFGPFNWSVPQSSFQFFCVR